MIPSNHFILDVERILSDCGWPSQSSPSLILQAWESFVDECEQGYMWSIYEYLNDIRSREKIEIILSSPKLNDYKEKQDFALQVDLVDKKFKSLLLPNVLMSKKYWWEQGVLRYACQGYAKDLYDKYGIKIDIVE